MGEAEANVVDPDAISHMEAPAWSSKCVNVGMYCNGQPVYGMVSQLVDDGSIYKSYVFGLKGEVVHVVKTFPYDLTNSITLQVHENLLKLKCKWKFECSWRLNAATKR